MIRTRDESQRLRKSRRSASYNQGNVSLLLQLPETVLLEVLSFLTAGDQCRFECVSKETARAWNVRWLDLLHAKFPFFSQRFSLTSTEGSCCKDAYIFYSIRKENFSRGDLFAFHSKTSIPTLGSCATDLSSAVAAISFCDSDRDSILGSDGTLVSVYLSGHIGVHAPTYYSRNENERMVASSDSRLTPPRSLVATGCYGDAFIAAGSMDGSVSIFTHSDKPTHYTNSAWRNRNSLRERRTSSLSVEASRMPKKSRVRTVQDCETCLEHVATLQGGSTSVRSMVGLWEQNALMVVTNQAVKVFDIGTLQPLVSLPFGSISPFDNSSRVCAATDGDGSVYVGTQKKLLRYDSRTKGFQTLCCMKALSHISAQRHGSTLVTACDNKVNLFEVRKLDRPTASKHLKYSVERSFMNHERIVLSVNSMSPLSVWDTSLSKQTHVLLSSSYGCTRNPRAVDVLDSVVVGGLVSSSGLLQWDFSPFHEEDQADIENCFEPIHPPIMPKLVQPFPSLSSSSFDRLGSHSSRHRLSHHLKLSHTMQEQDGVLLL